MAARIKIVSFSDVHFCHSWPLVTLEDIVLVHKRLADYCAEVQPEIVLFLGDRYRARQPKDDVREAADRCLRDLSAVQEYHGGYVACEVGNHDRRSESYNAGNTYSSVRVFKDVFKNVIVMDEPRTYEIGNWPIAIHALPAGYGAGAGKYEIHDGKFNILAFHGIVHGALLDQAGRISARGGIPLEFVDDPRWDAVLGGDVHIGQQFELKHTFGGYVGSMLRLTEDDADDKRGFLVMNLEKGRPPESELVEGGGPKFLRLMIDPATGAWPSDDLVRDHVVIANLRGTAAELREISNKDVIARMPTAKSVKVHRIVHSEVRELVRGISATTTPLDDVIAYIRSADRDGLDESHLVAKAVESLEDSPTDRRGMFG